MNDCNQSFNPAGYYAAAETIVSRQLKTKILLCILLLAPASTWAIAEDCPVKKQFKGIELYSWSSIEGAWVYAMLPGTNRKKTDVEIKTGHGCLLTNEELEAIFLLLGGEEVFWSGLMLPPLSVVERLTLSAEKAGVGLHILGNPGADSPHRGTRQTTAPRALRGGG